MPLPDERIAEIIATQPREQTKMADENKATCEICGELMPRGEEMFNMHGYSGPCPKPPKKVFIEYFTLEGQDGDLWIGVTADGKPHDLIGPFVTKGARQVALADMQNMVRSVGGKDGPSREQ